MNPADVAQAAPIVHDMSLFSLFWQAHFVVKIVMMGLLIASVSRLRVSLAEAVYALSRRTSHRWE